MLKIKKMVTAGATALCLTAGMVALAPAAQADTQTRWYNNLQICKAETNARVKHLRNKGYTVSIQRYCKGEQYIGYMLQYQTVLYVN
ncbi:hypothetical protein ACTXPA_15670 [Glutamicibacter arilaitensis]|uniref:hypothetical protein n=1 Tax=Glutamicibacter arilaitensis TaxID=256701 RepID=UPI003FD61FA0